MCCGVCAGGDGCADIEAGACMGSAVGGAWRAVGVRRCAIAIIAAELTYASASLAAVVCSGAMASTPALPGVGGRGGLHVC